MSPKQRRKLWDVLRPKLKKEFDALGITRCEVCGIGIFLGFAHRYKRRFIHTEEELRLVALLCAGCHEEIEFTGHLPMYERITSIIENREAGYNPSIHA